MQAFKSAFPSCICRLPKHPEQVSSRREESRTATKGVWACTTSPPTLISSVANRPLPMPLGAGPDTVLVVIDGMGFWDVILRLPGWSEWIDFYDEVVDGLSQPRLGLNDKKLIDVALDCLIFYCLEKENVVYYNAPRLFWTWIWIFSIVLIMEVGICILLSRASIRNFKPESNAILWKPAEYFIVNDDIKLEDGNLDGRWKLQNTMQFIDWLGTENGMEVTRDICSRIT